MSAHTAAAQLAEDRVVRDCLVNHWRATYTWHHPVYSVTRPPPVKSFKLGFACLDRFRFPGFR